MCAQSGAAPQSRSSYSKQQSKLKRSNDHDLKSQQTLKYWSHKDARADKEVQTDLVLTNIAVKEGDEEIQRVVQN